MTKDKNETSKFHREQLRKRIYEMMKTEGKPLCECGQLAMVGSKHCSDCFVKAVS